MISPALLDFVKGHEGLSLTSYQDAGGVWTIGYGSTGPDIIKGIAWTEVQCSDRLSIDLQRAQTQVIGLVKRKSLSSAPIDALTDFVYNLGSGALASSHLLQCVNAGDDIGAAKAFLSWSHVANLEVKGLLIRRMEEAIMYLKGVK